MRLHLLVHHLGNSCVDQILQLSLQRLGIVLQLFVIGAFRTRELLWYLRTIIDSAVSHIRLLLQAKIGRLPPSFWRHLAGVQVGIIQVVVPVTWLNSLEIHFLSGC